MLSIKTFVYIILILSAAFAAAIFSNSGESSWLVLATLFLSPISCGNVLTKRLVSVLVAGLLTSLLILGLGYLSSLSYVADVYLLAIVFFSAYLADKYSQYAYPLFAVSILVLIASQLPVAIGDNHLRVLFILMSTGIVIIAQTLTGFNLARDEFNSWCKVAITQLQLLTTDIFTCFLRNEYVDNNYYFERKLHVQKNKFLNAIVKLREYSHQPVEIAKSTWLDQLFVVLLDASQLRRRAGDYTIFQVCANELREIQQAIITILGQIKQYPLERDKWDTNLLSEKILNLEQLYQNILQVSARDPFAIMLFITNIKALRDLLEEVQ